MTATLDPPPGLTLSAQPGWLHISGVREEVTRFGKVWLPTVFQLDVWERGDAGEIHVTMMFAVEDGALGLRCIWSSPMEVDEALDWLRGHKPMEWWKRYALVALAVDTAERALSADIANAFLMAEGETEEEADAAYRRERARLLTPTFVAASTTSVSRRRNRVTAADLEETARVYQAAKDAGAPPTKAVEERFNLSRSGASRWLRMAREQGYLPPTTRGQR